jgi:E3 ubiquitin-protein ligase MARCH6
VVIIVFVAAYLFREWVIQNTAAAVDRTNEQQQQQPPTPDPVNTIENDRDQIHTRLEELRRELHRRRNNVNNDDDNLDTHEYNNPYSASVAGYHQMNAARIRRDSVEEFEEGDSDDECDLFNMNAPSGTQSPFASWRDYQQQDTPGSQLRHDIATADTEDNQSSPTTGTWRASEFGEASNSHTFERTDYFSEQVLNEAVLDEEDEMETEEAPVIQLQAHRQPPEVAQPNVEEPFDFVENMDGILEAIGMRGNLLLLLQNSILMCLMINLCLCVTVWIPYVIGRSVISVKKEEICLNME